MNVESEVEHRPEAIESNQLHGGAATKYPRAQHIANIALLVVAIVFLFWRVFFLGETLIDVNTLNNQLPWGYHAGQSDYPYNRRDLTDTYVTRDYFVVSAYRDGEFPLWNPYTMAGHPIYADGVTRTLSPFLLFYRFLDVPLGYSVARITELMLAAVFMYIFLVAIGAGPGGALMGSLVFEFSAHSMLHLTGLGWWGGLMCLPLILLFVDRAIRRGSYVHAILAGACLAAQFFCGYLPNQIYYLGAVVLYYAFFAFVARRGGSGSRAGWSLVAMMAVTLFVGLALSATQWVPSLELLSYSNRKIIGAELGYVYLPPWYAATLVFPNLFGTAYDAKALSLFTALGVSHDHILYLGIAALAPLGFGLYWLRHSSGRGGDEGTGRLGDEAIGNRLVLFASLAALSLIVMMTAPLYVHVTRYIPILQVIRVAVRAGVLFLFGAAVLVAFGTDLLLKSRADAIAQFGRLARRFALGAAAFVAVAVIGSYFVKVIGITIDASERGRLAFIRRASLALSAQFTPPNLSLLIPLGLLFLVAGIVWALAEKRLTSRTFLLWLVALLMADLFWNSNQFDHTFDRSLVFPSTEITDLLHTLPPGRVLVAPSNLETNRGASAGEGAEKIVAPPNTLLRYQIPTVSGKNQQFPKWYREFASLIEPQPNLSHVVFDQYRSPFFDLLNVRYVVTHESARLVASYDLLRTAEGVSLYENRNAMPRAFFASDVVAVSSPAESLAKMQSPYFDPTTQTVVEVDAGPSLLPVQSLLPDPRPQSPASALIAADGRNWVLIETDNLKDGLLVLSDNYYPGWRAWVDGAPTEVFRANHTMRAVKVPAGAHLVSFRFMPATFLVSVYISLAVAALTLLALTLPLLKRMKE